MKSFLAGRGRGPAVDRRLAPLLLTTLLAGAPAAAQSTAACPPPERYQGWPRDYRVERNWLPIVERRHFTHRVEMLISGEAAAEPGPDIGYTLDKFPNHHRALNALGRLGLRLNVGYIKGMDHSVDCYFERAIGFQPDDTVARLLYAKHLGATGRPELARQQLALTVHFAQDNPFTHYNIGLVALEIKDFDTALTQAHRAQALGMPRSELRELLQAAGRWKEPTAAAAAASEAGTPNATGGQPVTGKQ